jgi:RNA polymerase sigma-70 factor (ECF subfamily)
VKREKLQKEFVQLIAAQQKLIHSVCCLYYSSAEDRNDLFQEIVFQLWKSYPAFRHQSKVSTWIYRIALNTVFSKLRKEKAKPSGESLSNEHWQQIPESGSSAYEEDVEQLYQAIGRLSETDKAIVMLYLEEHSYEEIARVMNMSKTNISTRLNRIKIRLEKLIKLQSV